MKKKMKMKGTQTNQYFVILWQEEIEMLKTASQETVYRSIKSFCANGTSKEALSFRDISSRATITKSNVPKVRDELIQIGLIKITGYERVVGGKIAIYECPVAGHLAMNYKNGTVPNNEESVPLQYESVPTPGTKSIQSNKVIKGERENAPTQIFSKELGENKLQEIMTKLSLPAKTVLFQWERFLLTTEGTGKIYKNPKAIFIKWLMEDIENGKITVPAPDENTTVTNKPLIAQDPVRGNYEFASTRESGSIEVKISKETYPYFELGGYAFTLPEMKAIEQYLPEDIWFVEVDGKGEMVAELVASLVNWKKYGKEIKRDGEILSVLSNDYISFGRATDEAVQEYFSGKYGSSLPQDDSIEEYED